MASSMNFERYRSFVDDWQAFVEASRAPLPTCVWTNTLRATPGQVSNWLNRYGLAHDPLPWLSGAFRLSPNCNPGSRIPYLSGLYHIQEEASLLPVTVLGPRPGERVLDLCAAPGNKTAQVAVAVENRGTVVANDRSGGRMNVLRRTLRRLGICNVTTTVVDAAHFPIDEPGFDGVIADVPCSCEGTSRKHSDVMTNSSVAQSEHLSVTQATILRRAVRLVRPGGRIVYSTCTYAPEENERVVDAIIRERTDLRLLAVAVPGFRSEPGLTSWCGHAFDASMDRTARILPHHNDTGGFFVALLQRQEWI